MKISILNKWDITGGAARAAYRLYLGLYEQGHEVDYLVQVKKSENDHVQQLHTFDKSRRFLEAQTQKFYINTNRTQVSNTYFSFSYSGVNFANTASFNDTEIINLHWIEKLVSPHTLSQLVALNKPLVWTLHDERAFTGGCHYTAGCTGFETDCSHCQQLRVDPFSLPKRALQAKAQILEKADLTIVSPSQWLAGEARKSKLFRNNRIEVIPNSLETDVFTPVAKDQAKKSLAIDVKSVTLMFAAEDNQEKRKGLDELIRALQQCLQDARFSRACQDERILIMSAGSHGKELKQLPIKVKTFGKIDDDQKLAALYSATDIFVLPSLEDNLPNMMLEAMACGTPVIGFDTGGVVDVVIHQENGLVVAKGDIKALAVAIMELVFDEKKRRHFSQNCRTMIENRYKLGDQADKYQLLFEQLRSNSNNHEKKKYQSLDSEELDQLFDPVTGYSVRKALAGSNNADIRNAANNKHVNASPLLETVSLFHRISLLEQPVSKYRALKKILKLIFSNADKV